MSEVQITVTAAEGKKFGMTACAKSTKSALGKRGFHEKGIEIDINAIHPRVLEKLVLDAVQAKLRAAVKKLDQDRCSVEDVQAAMKEAFKQLKSGTAAKRSPPKRDPVKAEATKLLKAALKERNENSEEPQELDAKAYAEEVKEMFAAFDRFKKGKGSEDDEAIAGIVQGFLDTARARIEQEAHIGDILGKVLANRGTTTEAKPTPTEKVKAERAATKKGGRST